MQIVVQAYQSINQWCWNETHAFLKKSEKKKVKFKLKSLGYEMSSQMISDQSLELRVVANREG